MARSVDIIAAFASVLGLRMGDVTEIARRAREAGHFVKETKSPESPRATPLHCANLLVAILSNRPAKQAGKAIDQARSFRCNDQHLKNIENDPVFQSTSHRALRVFSMKNHSLIDGLEALFDYSATNPNYFASAFNIAASSVEMEVRHGSATIHVHSRSALIEEDRPRFSGMIKYYDALNCDNGDLTVTAQTTFSIIYKIGQVCAREY